MSSVLDGGSASTFLRGADSRTIVRRLRRVELKAVLVEILFADEDPDDDEEYGYTFRFLRDVDAGRIPSDVQELARHAAKSIRAVLEIEIAKLETELGGMEGDPQSAGAEVDAWDLAAEAVLDLLDPLWPRLSTASRGEYMAMLEEIAEHRADAYEPFAVWGPVLLRREGDNGHDG